MKLLKKLTIIATVLSSLILTGCAKNISPNTYDASEAGVASKVIPGVIIAKRAVNIDGNSRVGGLAGTVAGAAAGSGIGGSTAGNIVGAVGGAVIGGVAGNAVDKMVNHHQGYEYIIKIEKNKMISVTQTQDMQFTVGQHVLIIYGATTRLVPDTTVKSHA